MPGIADNRREHLREEIWPGSKAEIWPPDGSQGWAKIPRTAPLFFDLIRRKEFSGRQDPTKTYFDLLCQNRGQGLVEIDEHERAEWSGHAKGENGIRGWRRHVRILEELGFARVFPRGRKEFGYVILRDPHLALSELRNDGRIDDGWWNQYVEARLASGASKPQRANVTSMIPRLRRRGAGEPNDL